MSLIMHMGVVNMLEKNKKHTIASRTGCMFRSTCLITTFLAFFSLMSGLSEAAAYLNNPQHINEGRPIMSGDTVYLSRDLQPNQANEWKPGITVASGFKEAQIINVSVDVQSFESDGIRISGDAAAVIKKSHANSAAKTAFGAGVGIYNNSSADIFESSFQSVGGWENSAVAAVGNSFVRISSSDVVTDGFQREHAGVYVGTNSSGEVSGNKITVIENSPNSPGISDQAFGYGVHVDKKSYAKVTGNTIELKITAGTGDSGSTGIYADKSSAVDSSGNTFKSDGKGMLGISANEGSVITSVGDTFVADGPWSKAFQIYSNSVAVIRSADITANGGTGEVKNSGSPLAMKDTSRGIDAANNSKVDVSGSVIKMTGDSSNAISIMADSYGKIEKTTIETNGGSSHGIEVVGTPWDWGAPSNTASADIKDVKIHTTGSKSNGLCRKSG